jgi:hypothetical protein
MGRTAYRSMARTDAPRRHADPGYVYMVLGLSGDPQLRVQWDLSDSAAAWLTIAVQLGFVFGALISSLVNLSDIISPRAICTTVDLLRYSVHESLFDGSKGKSGCRRRPRHA